MQRAIRIGLAVVVMLALGAAQALAGMVIYSDGGMTGKSVVYFQDNLSRQDMEGLVVISDINKGVLTFINSKNKTYWQGTPQELEAAGDSEMDKMMEEALKQMPPAQREAMKKAMAEEKAKKKQPGPKITVKKTGEKAKIAGYDTVLYKIMVNGRAMMEMWLAPDLKISDEVDMAKMGKMMAASAGGGSGDSPMASQEVRDLYKAGYPLKQSTPTGVPGQTMVSTATKVEKKSLDAALFKVPSGYKKVASMMDVMQ